MVEFAICIPGCCEEYGVSQCGRAEVLIERGSALDEEAVLAHIQHMINEHDLGRCHAWYVEIDGQAAPAAFYARLED